MLIETTSQPDILEVIADLSNDEVFTPPKVANAVLDLLPVEVWSDPDLRWIDPGCKTGVFLREAARRLMIGLADKIPDETMRLDQILRNMLFGVAITDLTSLMARRTLYFSKDASSTHSVVKMPTSAGNIWMGRVEHVYLRGRCAECGASESQMEREGRENHAYAFIHQEGRRHLEKEFGMKFDVVIGNPPYQMNDGGGAGKSSVPLYNLFIEQALKLSPKWMTMIIPSRWMAGGKGLDGFRAAMLSDHRIRTLVDYPDANEVFPSIDLKSGVCYFLWDSEYDGKCEIRSMRGGSLVDSTVRPLDQYDVLVRDSKALTILARVESAGDLPLSDIVSTRRPFGISADHRLSGKKAAGLRKLYARGGGIGYVEDNVITSGQKFLGKWKVYIPKAGPGNSGGHVLPDVVLGQPFVGEPNSCCTETFLVVGPVASQDEAKSLESYLRTRFVRYLVSLRKVSQNSTSDSYVFVPQQKWDREWTDEELFKKYGITKEEQSYIAEMVKEMPT